MRLWGMACLASLLLMAPLAQAQTIDMPLRVTAGQAFTVDSRVSLVDFEGAGFLSELPPERKALITGVGLRVQWRLDILEHGPTGGRWRWSINDIGVDGLEPLLAALPGQSGADPGAAHRARVAVAGATDYLAGGLLISADLGFECRVDPTGRCVELLNFPAWRQRAERLQRSVSGILAVTGAFMPTTAAANGPQQTAAVRVAVDRLMSIYLDGYSPESAASAVAFYDGMSLVQGRSGAVGAAGTDTLDYPAPFGAPPLTSSGTSSVRSVDRAAGVAEVERIAQLDPADLKAGQAAGLTALRPALEALANAVPRAPDTQAPATPQLAELLAQLNRIDVTYQTRASGRIDLSTGLARSTSVRHRLSYANISADPGAPPLVIAFDVASTLTPGAPPAPRRAIDLLPPAPPPAPPSAPPRSLRTQP